MFPFVYFKSLMLSATEQCGVMAALIYDNISIKDNT